jgi:6-phosphogluconolactonase
MRITQPDLLSTHSSRPRWHVVDASNWLTTAVSWINQAAESALATRGIFHIVLAGGGTPEILYRALAAQQQNWSRWQIWFGDERCLPQDDPQRNSRMVAAAWLDRVDIPAANIHLIPAELGAATGARRYSELLHNLGTFDLVLLGLGQDGHTASLFPGHEFPGQAIGSGPDSPDVLPVFDAPKPPPERVTLSARRLSDSRCVLFLIRGADKREALNAWRQGATIPAAAIHPDAGVDLLIDTDACPPGEPE